MPTPSDDGGPVDSRDHGRKRGLQLTCGAALAATSAFAWATLLQPDLVPSGIPMNGSASLVIGLAGLAALGLVIVSARTNPARAEGAGAAADGREVPAASMPGLAPMRASVAELAKAAAAARISRILILAPPGWKAAEAVAVARHLSNGDEPTILVDFDGGCTVGDLALSREVESIAHIAASPTTFAHAIQRDRAGRTHLLAARLDAPNAASDAASVLTTLEEVYARVVAIVPADAETLAPLVHDDTALVVPRRIEAEVGLKTTIGRLMPGGLDEVVFLDEDLDERAKLVPHHTVVKRAVRA
ncbi:hypothetical protein [Aureimonas leprariae]|uniref:Uncharacterized protein n=1 Tax=Plantimonas leprariae TaxID=2615207 RepID=A0A7V7PQR1_9HYPH|nr:hypothetical protein [Aureimonas leprariae]KAB0680723.1 hypothetical protein F6X38_06885 [Aureimonas leprariae]